MSGVGRLHALAPAHRVASPAAAAAAVVALHATDPATVYLSVAARTRGRGAPVADIERALYDDRTVVRVMGMRRTMWAVPVDLVPVVEAACGRAVAANERRTLIKAIEDQGVARDGGRLVADLEAATLAALAERDHATTKELTKLVPGLATKVRVGGNSKWAAEVAIAPRIVLLLTCGGRVVRVRPRGSWTSTQHPYAVMPAFERWDTPAAQAELARRWLARFGPVSADVVGDLKWWAGWTVAATKQALAAAGWDGGDAARPPVARRARAEKPWAALVPALDPATMGWKQRSWYLGDLGSRLFDRNGNAGPAIWWCGRIVGGWAQRAAGEVVTRLLVDVGRDGEKAVEAEAARLQAWLDTSGGIVKPRFPTPLQQELLR
jgi:hypothetical protein